jgi:hypothetical protein
MECMKVEYPICLMVVLKADRCCITYEGVHDERRDFLTASKREDSEIEDFRKRSLISAVLEIPLVGEDVEAGRVSAVGDLGTMVGLGSTELSG